MNIKQNKYSIRKEIADLISRIKEQSDRIGNQKEIPQSELDLVLYRIEELHRKTVVFSYLNELPEEVPGAEFGVSDSVPGVQGAEKNETDVNVEPAATPPPIAEQKVPAADSNEEPVVPSVTPAPEIRSTEPGIGNLKDIRTFIGFNEKIMYMRQVFGGDQAAYDEVLNQINSMNSQQEADAFLQLIAAEYKWNHEHEPVIIFLQTVKRRFS